MNRNVKLMLIVLLIGGFISACGNWSYKSERGNPSLGHRKAWKNFLKVQNAEAGQPINTTTTHISNVSHKIALNRMNQALQNYQVDLGYKLSTVFQITNEDSSEGATGKDGNVEPAITAMVIQGHLYYVGFLDFPASSTGSFAMYQQLNRLIPAVAIADGEDETKPAWIRTADENGNPYQIKLHYTQQSASAYDDNNIYRHLRNRNYGTAMSCYSIDNPTLEFDDSWRPYFTVTYNYIDSCGFSNGNMDHPTELLVVDAQTGDVKNLKLDDPNTTQNERDPEINKSYDWVDQVYSPQVIINYVNAWGYNPDNYGKTSTLNQFRMDGTHLDEVMNYSNKNIEFVAYITSIHPDNSLIGVMCIDPREGTAIFYETQGLKAMTTKSLALSTITEAVNPEFNPNSVKISVEDLTLHTIYGEPTWQGELTKPAYNDDGKPYGSLYFGTVLLRADADLMSASVAWASSKHEAFTKYQKTLFLKQSDRIGSNVLEVKEIQGKVSSVRIVVIGGESTFLVKLAGSEDVWEVPIEYVGDPLTEEVVDTEPGDSVYMKYADVLNRKTHLTREIHDLTKGQVSTAGTQTSKDNK